MFRGQPEATWFVCHTHGRFHSCSCVVIITSPVSMAPCTLFAWTLRCVSGPCEDIALSSQHLAATWQILYPHIVFEVLGGELLE